MDELIKYFNGFKDKNAAVAFSGGVDSSLVAFYAREFADAVFVKTEFVPRYMLKTAKGFAENFGITYNVIDLELLEEIKYNSVDRCYLCKKRIFQKIKSKGYEVVFDGTNADDLGEDRPGLEAVRDERIYSPLAELGLGKKDVRKIMFKIDKKVAQQPQETCLATRIPTGSQLTHKMLARIDKAEDFIRSIGVSRVRVRDHFPLVRIQVPLDESVIVFNSKDLVQQLKDLGYRFITFDLEELR